jgi:hypothetical protein
MVKRLLALVIFCFLTLSVMPALAAGGAWSVWLYTADIGLLRQVDDTGALIASFSVPLPSDADAAGYPQNVAISHDGNLFAYVVRGNADDVPTLLVWDFTLGSWIAAYAMPGGARVSLEYNASTVNFSESDSQIAFSYGMEAGGWQVIVLDLITGDSFVLDAFSPMAISAGAPADPFLVPIVQLYRGAQVTFNMLPVPSDAMGGPSFVWDTTTSTVSPSIAYNTFGGDTLLMTGEYIVTMYDDAFAVSADPNAFPFIQFNTIQVYDPTLGGIFPFYSDGEASLYGARFVQNGERVATYGQRSDGSSFLMVLERDGFWVGESGVPVLSMQGVFNGLVFTTNDPVFAAAPGVTTLYYTETRAGLPATVGTPIWNSEAGQFVTILWTSDNFAIGPAAPPAWAMLAAPEYAVIPALGAPPLPSATPAIFAPPTVLPTFAPATLAAPAGLAVGSDAFINTTEGDVLRMRAGAGRSFAIVRELPDGTRVTLLEGPRSGDGLVWWRVRLADGSSGWVVEAVDGIQTLLPVTSG